MAESNGRLGIDENILGKGIPTAWPVDGNKLDRIGATTRIHMGWIWRGRNGTPISKVPLIGGGPAGGIRKGHRLIYGAGGGGHKARCGDGVDRDRLDNAIHVARAGSHDELDGIGAGRRVGVGGILECAMRGAVPETPFPACGRPWRQIREACRLPQTGRCEAEVGIGCGIDGDAFRNGILTTIRTGNNQLYDIGPRCRIRVGGVRHGAHGRESSPKFHW